MVNCGARVSRQGLTDANSTKVSYTARLALMSLIQLTHAMDNGTFISKKIKNKTIFCLMKFGRANAKPHRQVWSQVGTA